jgi:hypothetical protein
MDEGPNVFHPYVATPGNAFGRDALWQRYPSSAAFFAIQRAHDSTHIRPSRPGLVLADALLPSLLA